MDIAVVVISILLIAAGVIGVLSVGTYWFVLRMDDLDHYVNVRLTLWAIVVLVLGIAGLLWASTMADSTQFL